MQQRHEPGTEEFVLEDYESTEALSSKTVVVGPGQKLVLVTALETEEPACIGEVENRGGTPVFTSSVIDQRVHPGMSEHAMPFNLPYAPRLCLQREIPERSRGFVQGSPILIDDAGAAVSRADIPGAPRGNFVYPSTFTILLDDPKVSRRGHVILTFYPGMEDGKLRSDTFQVEVEDQTSRNGTFFKVQDV